MTEYFAPRFQENSYATINVFGGVLKPYPDLLEMNSLKRMSSKTYKYPDNQLNQYYCQVKHNN